MSNMTHTPGKKHHATRILEAQSEEEVNAAINDLSRELNVSWHPIGGQENNYGVVENQSSSPLGALNEIISNGIDAVLRRRYRDRHGDEYDESLNLDSYQTAADRLLDRDDEIRIIADGIKGELINLTVRDPGEGQTHEDFEDTFVGLLKPGQAKQGWPFLQGQFGMGSTAVLPHCGDHGYKAIFSAGMEDPEHWSWTVTRRNREGNAYDYLKINDEIPSFTGTLRDEYEVGSFVKLFNYDLSRKSNITAGLRPNLARTMTTMPVPIRLDERRGFDSSGMETPATGFKDLISRKSDYVSQRVQRVYDFGGEIGQREVEIVIFKEDEVIKEDEDLSLRGVKKTYFVSNRLQNNRAVFFTVNGQVHGDKGLSFIKNRCDKYHTARDTVVMVDFSDLGPAQLTDLFTPARDRIQDKPMAKRLESGMQDLITNDPMLVEEEQRRREKFTRDKRDEKMSDMLEDLIQQNDDLLEYLDTGDKASSKTLGGDAEDETEEYEAPFFPDQLIPIDENGELWDSDERFEIEVPVNRDRYVSFFLNAPNNFFSRDDRPGTAIVSPQELVRSHGITDGTWTMQLRPFEAATPGMTMPVSVEVGAEGMDPLKVEFNIQYTQSVEDEESGSSPSKELPPMEQIDFPQINAIYEDDWDTHPEDWDAKTPVRVQPGDEMQLWVNFDAAPIKNFMRRHNFRTTGKETVKETWRVGVALYAVSTYIEVEDEFSPGRIQPDHVTEVSMRGIVQSMLDQQISNEELEALTV